VLLIGQKDTTVARQIGNYAQLGRQARASIERSGLVPFEDLGHAPQIQDPERFNWALADNLDRRLH
jgi:pimeloyl-ACP methyl ester carboxylesterase